MIFLACISLGETRIPWDDLAAVVLLVSLLSGDFHVRLERLF